MRWQIDDTPEQAAFREELRGWIRAALSPEWIAAIESGDDDAYAAARQAAEGKGWNPFSFGRDHRRERLRRAAVADRVRRHVGRALGGAPRP